MIFCRVKNLASMSFFKRLSYVLGLEKLAKIHICLPVMTRQRLTS